MVGCIIANIGGVIITEVIRVDDIIRRLKSRQDASMDIRHKAYLQDAILQVHYTPRVDFSLNFIAMTEPDEMLTAMVKTMGDDTLDRLLSVLKEEKSYRKRQFRGKYETY